MPFGFGLSLLAALYVFAEISGGHFNPAISLGLFLDRRLSFEDLLGYWIFQFAGAIMASLLLLVPFNHDLVKATATYPTAGYGPALFLEITFSAIFVLVILQSTKSDRFGGSALISIPLTLIAIHFAIIPFSGSSVNPARSLGPALVGDQWHGFWIFVVGPGGRSDPRLGDLLDRDQGRHGSPRRHEGPPPRPRSSRAPSPAATS